MARPPIPSFTTHWREEAVLDEWITTSSNTSAINGALQNLTNAQRNGLGDLYSNATQYHNSLAMQQVYDWATANASGYLNNRLRRYVRPVAKSPDKKLIQKCLIAQLETLAVTRAKEIGLPDEPDAAQAIRALTGLAFMELDQLKDRIAALESQRG